jgi:hypothetical protein
MAEGTSIGFLGRPKTIEEVVKRLAARPEIVLEIENVAKRGDVFYGAEMQMNKARHDDRLFVLSNEHLSKTATKEIKRSLNAWVVTPEVIEKALRIVARVEVNWLQSIQGETHPGGWQDRTGLLASSYRAKVQDEPVELRSY